MSHRLCSHTDTIQALLETCTTTWCSGCSQPSPEPRPSSTSTITPTLPRATPTPSPEPHPCSHLYHHPHPPALPSSLISAAREPLSCQHHTLHGTIPTSIPTCLLSSRGWQYLLSRPRSPRRPAAHSSLTAQHVAPVSVGFLYSPPKYTLSFSPSRYP